MRAWVASLDDEALARTRDDPKAHFPLWYYLLHMVTHSQQHRAESAQLLTQLGRSPGDIDFLDYADSARAAVKVRLVRAPRRPLLLEAVGAVHRLVAPRLEWHTRFLAAVAARRAEHLARSAATAAVSAAASTATTTAGATRRTIGRTTAWCVL